MTQAPLRPLKRFGQNFLIDPNIRRKIIAAVNPAGQDAILEIGPGRGSLTIELARSARVLIGVEIDRGLCSALRDQLKDSANIRLIYADILKCDLKAILKAAGVKKVRVVSNLPYYITTPVLEYLFGRLGFIEDIFITIQKEVADRLRADARDTDYGSLSCFVRYFCETDVLFKIAPGCFRPRPRVASAFVRLLPRRDPKKCWGVVSEALLFRVIRACFGQRRKKVSAGLKKILDERLMAGLADEAILGLRPQDISLGDFVLLSNRIVALSERR